MLPTAVKLNANLFVMRNVRRANLLLLEDVKQSFPPPTSFLLCSNLQASLRTTGLHLCQTSSTGERPNGSQDDIWNAFANDEQIYRHRSQFSMFSRSATHWGGDAGTPATGIGKKQWQCT